MAISVKYSAPGIILKNPKFPVRSTARPVSHCHRFQDHDGEGEET
jgi:hypothetical protein